MKVFFSVIACFVCFLFTGYTTTNIEISFTHKWDTVRVLKNPHKGWYHHLLDNGIETYAIKSDAVFASFPGMDHLYLRLAWSYLEPKEGQYDWHRIDEVVNKYVPLGYKISFRISSKETGTFPGSVGIQVNNIQYATPFWVAEAGAKGSFAENDGIKSWVPKWNDSIYLAKLDQFNKAFAARYDGKPWVSYIDIGSIGEWGEGHTHFSTRIPPTVEDVKANIDVYVKNYKHSQLVVTDDLLYYGKPAADVDTLYRYAVSKGITLRDDSPMVDWYLDHNLATWSVSHPQFYNPLYLSKPIVFELQHYREVKRDGNWPGKNGADNIKKYGYSGATIMRNAIKLMHATYIGYHGYAEDWLADNPQLSNELANLCGYWYFPVHASVPANLQPSKNSITIEWLNKGIAPAYNPFQLVLKFTADKSNENFEVIIPNANNLQWLPAINKKENYVFDLPAAAKKGRYQLSFKLQDISEKMPVPIGIGVRQNLVDKDGFVNLAVIHY